MTGVAPPAAAPAAEPAAHAFGLPVSDEELWEQTAAFLGEGLAAGEQVVYFENRTAEPVLDRLVDDGVAVRGPLETGQLVVVPTDVVEAMAGATAGHVLATLGGLIDGALEDFPGVRILGEASAGIRTRGGAAMLEYESRFDELVAGRPAQIRCLYDRGRYDEEDIARLRAVHHHELPSPLPLYDDTLLRITTPRPFAARVAGEVDHSNRPWVRRALEAALDDALRSPHSPPVVELDLASLRFLDVGGAAGLVHAAEDFPHTHTLVLSGVRPGVQRVLDRCGAPFTERLRVEPHPGPRRPGPATGETAP